MVVSVKGLGLVDRFDTVMSIVVDAEKGVEARGGKQKKKSPTFEHSTLDSIRRRNLNEGFFLREEKSLVYLFLSFLFFVHTLGSYCMYA